MKTVIGIVFVFLFVSHVWTTEVGPAKQKFKKNTGLSLKAPLDANRREKETFEVVDDKKKLSKIVVTPKRNLQSFLTPYQNGCFLHFCRAPVLKCKENAACWSAWLYDYPRNGVRAANYKYKSVAGFTAINKCKQSHVTVIMNALCTQTDPSLMPVVIGTSKLPGGNWCMKYAELAGTDVWTCYSKGPGPSYYCVGSLGGGPAAWWKRTYGGGKQENGGCMHCHNNKHYTPCAGVVPVPASKLPTSKLPGGNWCVKYALLGPGDVWTCFAKNPGSKYYCVSSVGYFPGGTGALWRTYGGGKKFNGGYLRCHNNAKYTNYA